MHLPQSLFLRGGALMARALRGEVLEPDVIGVHHCFNRIVRRSFFHSAGSIPTPTPTIPTAAIGSSSGSRRSPSISPSMCSPTRSSRAGTQRVQCLLRGLLPCRGTDIRTIEELFGGSDTKTTMISTQVVRPEDRLALDRLTCGRDGRCPETWKSRTGSPLPRRGDADNLGPRMRCRGSPAS